MFNSNQSRTSDVNDGKCLLDVPPRHPGAGWHNVSEASLVLLDVELEHSLLRRDLAEPLDIDCTKMLDIYRLSLQPIASQKHQAAIARGLISPYTEGNPRVLSVQSSVNLAH